ncbi:MAG: threonylcarbamoyladenosine tRNA methylthiotransferase [Candidatus Diapherotrites archaeon]|nr:threonylcarbamoyladenosine tRNA methylthiotransferase [Candidatus Diapherotrites archaeon]MDN5366766.1 threonylcarbamoyladenosine tRNA methylthiotransferase [Candidatus Diapherotrites archaeon]
MATLFKIPRTNENVAKYYIETYGCVANKVDSEIIMAALSSKGWERVEYPEEADTIILNTCAVKEKTIAHMLSRIRRLPKEGKKFVVTGCLANVLPEEIRKIAPEAEIAGPREWEKLSEILGVKLPDRKAGVPQIRTEPFIASVVISEGCTGTCTYCATKFARKYISSYRPGDIVRSVKEAVEEGRKEIRLTSQDTGAYGVDIGTNLVELLGEILDSVKGDYRIRVGMMNVDHAVRLIDEGLLDVFEDPRLYKFFHIPVQSGNDRILKLMGRNYTVEDFREVVMKIRKRFPLASISTDIIVGFPTETWEEFLDSARLIEELKIDVLNISRYSAIPGTVAARMKGHISPNEKKRRSKYLTEVHLRVGKEWNKQYVGKTFRTLFVEKGRHGAFIGRTEHYKPVVVHGGNILGEFKDVYITEALPLFLRGEIQE